MINSKDLTKQVDVTVKTLTRWHQMGLIPEPKIRTSPSGRGKLGYWPDDTLNKCLKIRALVKNGYALRDIKRMTPAESDAAVANAVITRMRFHSWSYRPHPFDVELAIETFERLAAIVQYAGLGVCMHDICRAYAKEIKERWEEMRGDPLA